MLSNEIYNNISCIILQKCYSKFHNFIISKFHNFFSHKSLNELYVLKQLIMYEI
jgi:hypothetical protein